MLHKTRPVPDNIVIATSLILAIAAVFVLNDSFPLMVRIGAAVCFSAFGGLIPGVLFAGVPVHVTPPNHVSSVNGLMLQGVAIGQLTGPAISSYVVEQTGNWSDALYVVLPLAALAVLGDRCGRLIRITKKGQRRRKQMGSGVMVWPFLALLIWVHQASHTELSVGPAIPSVLSPIHAYTFFGVAEVWMIYHSYIKHTSRLGAA